MELVLAMDLKNNRVVHGKSGQRAGYKPLDWGCSPTAEPLGFVKAIAPKYIYIADLDRIEGTGSHDRIVRECARMVSGCYVDRGAESPEDMLNGYHIHNIIGTETGRSRSHPVRWRFSQPRPEGRSRYPVGPGTGGHAPAGEWLEIRGLYHPEYRGGRDGIRPGPGDCSRRCGLRITGNYSGGAVLPARMTWTSSAMPGLTVPSSPPPCITGKIPLAWIRRGSCC